MSYSFFPSSYAALISEIADLRKKEKLLRKQQQAAGGKQASVEKAGDGDFGHHDDITRELATVNALIAGKCSWRDNATIIDPPAEGETERLRAGHIATIQRYADQECSKPINGPERILVGDFHSTDTKTSSKELPVWSYDAPILEKLMGRRVDPDRDPEIVRLGSKIIYVELRKIECLDAAKIFRLKMAS